MSDSPDTVDPADEPAKDGGPEVLSISGALGNAVRILRNAEMERDLALMERLTDLADSWLGVAALITQL
jgi:hypothetical protein